MDGQVRDGELPEAMEAFEEMKAEGEVRMHTALHRACTTAWHCAFALHVHCMCTACTLQVPSHAVYEMLMRGCTIAMRRVGPGEQSDHLTRNLIGRVGELWAEMEVAGRKPDYKTYNEPVSYTHLTLPTKRIV